MAAFPLVCSSGTPLVSPVFVKHAGGGEGRGGGGGGGFFCKVVSQPGIPKTVIAVTLSGTSVIEIRGKRRCLLCHCVHRACRDITSCLNGRWRLISDGYTGLKISQLSHWVFIAPLLRRGMSNGVMPFVNGVVRWVFFLQMRNALAVIIYCLLVVTRNHLP